NTRIQLIGLDIAISQALAARPLAGPGRATLRGARRVASARARALCISDSQAIWKGQDRHDRAYFCHKTHPPPPANLAPEKQFCFCFCFCLCLCLCHPEMLGAGPNHPIPHPHFHLRPHPPYQIWSQPRAVCRGRKPQMWPAGPGSGSHCNDMLADRHHRSQVAGNGGASLWMRSQLHHCRLASPQATPNLSCPS
ncbi:hypothetical protein N431DRAFT_49354, partial [Stipitochalara longipes BDJ]